MTRFTASLSLLIASQRRAAFRAASAEKSVTTITLGQDVDYPPYATRTDAGEPAGFGKDFADGMTALCDDLEIVVVEERWGNCWSSEGGGALGSSVADGTLDGCMTYTHTKGVRDELADFSDAILSDNKPAGLLTLLDGEGNPRVRGTDDLGGRTIIDVGGWAPTADGLGLVTNFCLDGTYSGDFTLVVATETDGSGANDVAMRMLRDGEGDAVFLYADQAREYLKCPEGAAWDCTLWEGLGTEYAYVQTGQFGYAVNGTTLALSQKGSGIREVLRPCMSRFMETKEYYDICVKHDLVGDCFKNEFFEGYGKDVDKTSMPTNLQTGDCSDGYCPCEAGAEEAGDEEAGAKEAGAEEADAEEASAEGAGAEEASAEEAGAEVADTKEATAEGADAEEADAEETGAEEAGAEEPDADDSGNAMFGHYAGSSFCIISAILFILV